MRLREHSTITGQTFLNKVPCVTTENNVSLLQRYPQLVQGDLTVLNHTVAELKKADICLTSWCVFGKPVLRSQCQHTSFIHVTRLLW